jgi:hypothetical protein
VNAVEQIVLEELGWIWREQLVSDFGIDGQIELVDEQGKPTGRLIAAQVKTGKSYFRGKGQRIALPVDDAHLRYWQGHALPAILVLHNPDTKETIWQWASLEAARASESGWLIDIPKHKTFGASSKHELLDQKWSSDGADLRRRFVLDREFMALFKNRDVYLTIDKWLNKSLQYRGAEVRFDDPNKRDPDYIVPFFATSHFDIADLMHHFFPWLDYDYYEEPDDSSGEVEGHVMTVSLSKPAEAFLTLESFFADPPGPRRLRVDEDAVEPDDDWRDAHSLDEPE